MNLDESASLGLPDLDELNHADLVFADLNLGDLGPPGVPNSQGIQLGRLRKALFAQLADTVSEVLLVVVRTEPEGPGEGLVVPNEASHSWPPQAPGSACTHRRRSSTGNTSRRSARRT